MQGIGLCTLCGPPSVLAWFVLLLPLVTCSVNIHRRAQDLCFSTPSNRPRSVDLLPTSKRTTISTPHPAPLTCSLSASTRVTSCALKPRASQMSGKLPQPAVDPPHSLQEARDMTGWREGDCFVFGYGALLASSVWKRRGIDESLSGRRKVLCAVAAHHGLKFNVKGGYASVEPLSEAHGKSHTREAHGIIVPVSQAELSLHAAKEGGYELKPILVRLYGSDLEVDAVAFVSSWWRRTQADLNPSEAYLELIRSGAAARGLCPDYRAWLDESFEAATPQQRIEQRQITTPGDVAARVLLASVAACVLWASLKPT